MGFDSSAADEISVFDSAFLCGYVARALQVSGFRFEQLWGWSIFEWWDLRGNENLRQQMKLDHTEYMRKVLHIQRQFPRLPIRVGSSDGRERTYFTVAETGEVHTFGSNEFMSTIILGNLKDPSVEATDLLANPVFKKGSPKTQSWFSIRMNELKLLNQDPP